MHDYVAHEVLYLYCTFIRTSQGDPKVGPAWSYNEHATCIKSE